MIVKVITVWNLVTIWQNFWLFLYVAHYLFPANYRIAISNSWSAFLHWKVYYDIHNYVISFPLCMSYSFFVSWHMFVFRVQVKCPCEVCNFACLSCIECKMTLWWKKKVVLLTQLTHLFLNQWWNNIQMLHGFLQVIELYISLKIIIIVIICVTSVICCLHIS